MYAYVRQIGITAGVIGALCIAAPSALAQATVTGSTSTQQTSSRSEGGIGIGIKGGPLFSTLSSEAFKSPLGSRTGWIGGLFIGGNRAGVVGVGVDLLFARKTVATDFGDTNLDYFQVPIYLRVNIGSSRASGARVYAVVGPAIDVRLKGEFKFEGITKQTEAVDLGLQGGAGVEFARFLVEGRYTKGLRNIGKDLGTTHEIKSKSFAIMLGVRFN
jgi:hypothetical protein